MSAYGKNAHDIQKVISWISEWSLYSWGHSLDTHIYNWCLTPKDCRRNRGGESKESSNWQVQIWILTHCVQKLILSPPACPYKVCVSKVWCTSSPTLRLSYWSSGISQCPHTSKLSTKAVKLSYVTRHFQVTISSSFCHSNSPVLVALPIPLRVQVLLKWDFFFFVGFFLAISTCA